ncbi:MAG: NAD(P)H-dependent glycerol-3-phosphate dehydrogenase [Thermodesulfovibrionia bacterium]
MDRIAVIGGGSWGTAISVLLAEKGYDISLWVYEEELVDDINIKRVNTRYHPNTILPYKIMASSDLKEVMDGARYLINAVPSQHTRGVFSRLSSYIGEDVLIISVSKGIERGSLKTVTEVIKELTGFEASALSGPSFASEVIQKKPTAVTIATRTKETADDLQRLFNTDYFRVYTNSDVLGVELGGALKNVMAIAAGISDGLGLGLSARAALITRGLAEMTRLGVAMGAMERTFWGLSGLGDLVLTCTGSLSRNYTVGFRLGKGEGLKDILSGMIMVAEGVATAESAHELSKRYKVEMPIVEQVYRVIYEDKDPMSAVNELMRRGLKPEY